MTRHSRALPALAGAAALTLGSITPAAAARWVHNDPAGDVVSYSFDEGTGTQTGPNAEPENTTSDITKFSVYHKARRVVFRTSLRNITAGSGEMLYQIRTKTRTYSISQRLGTNQQTPAFTFSRANGRHVRCSGLQRSVDRNAELASLSVPRRCLNGPRWVRIGAGAVDAEDSDASETSFIDDALRDGFSGDGLARTPRLRRG